VPSSANKWGHIKAPEPIWGMLYTRSAMINQMSNGCYYMRLLCIARHCVSTALSVCIYSLCKTVIVMLVFCII